VLERARRIQRELEAMRDDLAMLTGLEVGSATLGIVGTASRWIIPDVVTDMRAKAPGVTLRVNEGASERLFAEVLVHELAQAVVTEPVQDKRLVVEHLLDEALVGLVPDDARLPKPPVPLAALARLPLVLRPPTTRCASRVEHAARAEGATLDVPVEVEGVRLIADLVASGTGASILPETAIPRDLTGLGVWRWRACRRGAWALVTARDAQLTIADRAVRQSIFAALSERARRRNGAGARGASRGDSAPGRGQGIASPAMARDRDESRRPSADDRQGIRSAPRPWCRSWRSWCC